MSSSPQNIKNIKVKELLRILTIGCVVVVAFAGAPNVLSLLKPLLKKEKEFDNYYPHSVEKATRKLLRKGFAEIVRSTEGYEVILTDKGKKEILKYDMADMKFSSHDTWDGKWRMVIFDIPNKYKHQRRMLLNKLKNMGCYSWQESVLIYPYDINKEVKFMREVLGIPHYVKLGVLDKVENEDELKDIFHLSN